MAEYINKELAIEGMWAGLQEGTICGPEDTETFLRSLPAADVEPVVHAHWVIDDDHKSVLPWAKCSACGEFCLSDAVGDPVLSDRCPNCGAKMDGEVTQDERRKK